MDQQGTSRRPKALLAARRPALSTAWLLAILASCPAVLAFASAPDTASADPQRGLRQVAGLLDYVGTDYAGAVGPDGKVLDANELREQVSLSRDARDLALKAGLGPEDPVVAGLDQLAARMSSHATPAEVFTACRKLRATLVQESGLVLEPSAAPDMARARDLYARSQCAGCHGPTGAGDGPAGLALTPRPANFLDPARMAGVSPSRAFNSITFGVTGTAMASFDTLPAAARWDLAFYVLAMRHEQGDVARGKAAFAAAGRPFSPTFTRLSGMSEADVDGALEKALALPEDRAAAHAWLRASAPSEAADAGTFALARQQVRAALDAYHAGDVDEARRLLVSAYLDGVEPHEAAVRARDAALCARLEEQMLAVRTAAARHAPSSEVDERAAAALATLDRAEEGRLGPTATFLGSAAISLREGFEAVLLLAALLGMVRRRGVPEHARFVHFGWMAAVVAGLLTWILARHLLGGLQRELAEGLVGVLAALVLLGVTHWTLGQAMAKQWMGYLARQIGGSAGAWAVLALAFLAVYRELFEVVLFYQALLLDAGERRALVMLGAVVGLAALAVATVALQLIGRKLRPARFMMASSVVLAGLAFVLVGEGVHSLQEAGVVAMTGVRFVEVPLLGLHATRQGLLAQLAVLLALLASAAWTWRQTRPLASPQPA